MFIDDNNDDNVINYDTNIGPSDENYVCDNDEDEYYLTQSTKPDTNNLWTYNVYNYSDEKVATWKSRENALEMDPEQWDASMTKSLLSRECNLASKRNDKGVNDLAKKAQSYQYPQYQQMSLFDDDDDYVYTPPRNRSNKTYNYPSYSNYSYSSSYTYKPQPKKTGYLDKLNKSDTLVFHKTDSTTTMLKQIYEGKGWDVLNDSYVDLDEVHKLLESHDRILMLGHGYSGGLIGGNINSAEAPYLADKKLFVIWCNADAYFTKYLPNKHGFFCTGNMPSDDGEAAAVGFHVSHQYMDENITYWCKLCGDVAEQALNGDAEGAVKYIRNEYWKKYGQGYNVEDVSDDSRVKQDIPDEVRITKYNWVRTKVQ